MRNFTEAYNAHPQIYGCVRDVMGAMGKAMWHFAQIKEIIWYEVGYEHVKEFFHHMEHSYGDHIDKLKELLAQEGLPLIYPGISGLGVENRSLSDCFDLGIELIDEVNKALSTTVEVMDMDGYEPLARQVENIQINNYKPKAIMLQARTMAENGGGSASSFDNWFKEITEGFNYG